MAQAERVSPKYVKDQMQSGDTMLVCAYDDEGKFNQNHLAGAISLDSFEKRLDSIDKRREIVFY